MRALGIICFILASVLTALAPAAGTVYSEAYPADEAKHQALRHCQADPGFNRLLAADRSACYKRYLNAAPAKRGVPAPSNTASRQIQVTEWRILPRR